MQAGPLTAGHYRVEVHDWSGPAGLQVTLNLTFYNSDGVAGT